MSSLKLSELSEINKNRILFILEELKNDWEMLPNNNQNENLGHSRSIITSRDSYEKLTKTTVPHDSAKLLLRY